MVLWTLTRCIMFQGVTALSNRPASGRARQGSNLASVGTYARVQVAIALCFLSASIAVCGEDCTVMVLGAGVRRQGVPGRGGAAAGQVLVPRRWSIGQRGDTLKQNASRQRPPYH